MTGVSTMAGSIGEKHDWWMFADMPLAQSGADSTTAVRESQSPLV